MKVERYVSRKDKDGNINISLVTNIRPDEDIPIPTILINDDPTGDKRRALDKLLQQVHERTRAHCMIEDRKAKDSNPRLIKCDSPDCYNMVEHVHHVPESTPPLGLCYECYVAEMEKRVEEGYQPIPSTPEALDGEWLVNIDDPNSAVVPVEDGHHWECESSTDGIITHHESSLEQVKQGATDYIALGRSDMHPMAGLPHDLIFTAEVDNGKRYTLCNSVVVAGSKVVSREIVTRKYEGVSDE